MKKQVCTLLALVMLVMSFTVLPATNAAAEEEYPSEVLGLKNGDVSILYDGAPTESLKTVNWQTPHLQCRKTTLNLKRYSATAAPITVKRIKTSGSLTMKHTGMPAAINLLTAF